LFVGRSGDVDKWEQTVDDEWGMGMGDGKKRQVN
jgi:hypothetical protein